MFELCTSLLFSTLLQSSTNFQSNLTAMFTVCVQKYVVTGGGKFEFTVSAMKNSKLLLSPAILTEFHSIYLPVNWLPVICMSMTAILNCHDYAMTWLCQESDRIGLHCMLLRYLGPLSNDWQNQVHQLSWFPIGSCPNQLFAWTLGGWEQLRWVLKRLIYL